MRYYRINIEDGYITGVVAGVSAANANCTEEKYQTVRDLLLAPPDAPEGHYYRLTEALEWELQAEPEIDPEAGEADYIAALTEMGVGA